MDGTINSFTKVLDGQGLLIIESKNALGAVILNEETKLSGLLILEHLIHEAFGMALAAIKCSTISLDNVAGKRREINIVFGLGTDSKLL